MSHSEFFASAQRGHDAVQSLASIVGDLPDAVALSDNPATALLRGHEVYARISARLRSWGSGAGGDDLCRWLYDTFQGGDPSLQLAVIQFVPTIAGVYLTRALSRQPLAGFEAVLLALYAHETINRGGQPQTVTIPNLSISSVYHEAKANGNNTKAGEEELNVGILSLPLEPHGTVRSTRRARIVGVALELYYSKIALMPISSKIDFCDYCLAWSGQELLKLDDGKEGSLISGSSQNAENDEESREKSGEKDDNGEPSDENGGRIPLPWELFQPVVRILGHCLLGQNCSDELKKAACDAVKCMHARAMHEMNPQAILASRSLLRLGKMTGKKDRMPELSMISPSREYKKMEPSTIDE